MSDKQTSSTHDQYLSMVERMSSNLWNMNSSPRSPHTPTNKVAKRSTDATPGNSITRSNCPGQFQNRNPSNDTYMSSTHSQLAVPPPRPQSGYGLQTGSHEGLALHPQLRGPLGHNNNAGLMSPIRQLPQQQQSVGGLWQPQQPYLNRLWQPNGQQQQPRGQTDPRTQQRSFTDPALSMASAPLLGSFSNASPKQSFPRNFRNTNQNNLHNQAQTGNRSPFVPRGPLDPNRTPRISSLPTTSSGGFLSAPPPVSNMPGPLAGQKRRLASPSPEPPTTALVHLQNGDHPAGINVSVPQPAFMKTSLYLPSVQPRNPNTTATATTLRALAPAIQVESYDCTLGCRNKGTCVHYHFVLGARRTPDGLICKKCHKAGELNELPKAKRVCPFHYDPRVKGALVTLPCDYLATAKQREWMVEILERAWRNDWVRNLDEIRYAAPAEAGDDDRVPVPGASADVDAGVQEDVRPSVDQVQQQGGAGPLTSTSAPAQGPWGAVGNQQSTTDPGVDKDNGKATDKTWEDQEGELLGWGTGMDMGTTGMHDNEKTPQPHSAPAAMQSFAQDDDLGFSALPAPDPANYGLDDLFLDDADFSVHGYGKMFPGQQPRQQ